MLFLDVLEALLGPLLHLFSIGANPFKEAPLVIDELDETKIARGPLFLLLV